MLLRDNKKSEEINQLSQESKDLMNEIDNNEIFESYEILETKKEYKVRQRQRPDFREAKHACRRLYKEHVESTGQGKMSIHPAQQRRQHSQQQYDEHEEYAFSVHPRTGWRYYPSTRSSFILAMAPEQ